MLKIRSNNYESGGFIIVSYILFERKFLNFRRAYI